MARAPLWITMTAALLLGACVDDKGFIPATTTGITTVNPSTLGDSTTTGADTTGSTSDDAGSGTANQSTGVDTTGADTTTTGVDASTGADTTTTDVDGTSTGELDPIEQCLQEVELGDECGECSCMSCLEELRACQMDEGCVEIRICAQEAGCGGLDCLGPCSSVITLYGGPFGESGMLAQAIGYCVGTECPGLCN